MKKNLPLLLPIFIIPILIGGCTMKQYTKDMFTMDTVANISVYGNNAETAGHEIEEELDRLNQLLDRMNDQGDIQPLNNGEEKEVSPETAEIVQKGIEYTKDTDGAFDITIASVMDVWGFYGYNTHVPTDKQLSAAMDKINIDNVIVNGNDIRVADGTKIDLGGIAKGYASDKIREIAAKNGITSALVNLGGNVVAIGQKNNKKDWRIGIKNPDETTSYALTVDVNDKCVITSGGYERNFTDSGKVYHHIIDSSTGYPAENDIKSVSVITSDGARGDALSTALFVMGTEKASAYLSAHKDIDVIIIKQDNSVCYTEGIKSKLEFKSVTDGGIIGK